MKKHILFFLFGMFISFLGNAQTDSLSKTVSKDTSKENYIEEQKPQFPGGDSELINWISKNLIYPKDAYKNKIEGKVYLSFVLDTDGSVIDVNIVRSVNELLDKEAKRVIETMPKWIPATQNGIPVRIKYTLPIVFKL